MDRARTVDAAEGADGLPDVVDPLVEEIRQSLFLLVGALGLMGMVAITLLALTSGSGG